MVRRIKYLYGGVLGLIMAISAFFFPGELLAAAYDNIGDKYITVAYVGGLTGELGQASRRSLNSLQLAIDEANRKGGAHGKMFRIISFDTENSAVRNVGIFKEILDAKAVAVTGVHTSNDGLILADLAEKAHIPLVVASATHPEITKGRKYVTRVCFDDDVQGKSLADFAYNKLRKRNALVVVNVNDSFSLYLAHVFVEAFKQNGGTIHHIVDIRTGDTKYRSVTEELRNESSIDLLFLATSAIESGYIISEVLSDGYTKTILGSDGWQSNHLDTLLSNLKKYNVDAYYSAHWHKDIGRPRAVAYIRKYRQVFGDDISSFDADAVLTYDSGSLLTRAIEKSPSLRAEDIVESIRQTSIEGATGKIEISKDGVVTKSVIMMKIINGIAEPFMEKAR